MIGLEKVTGKIISEAEAYAENTLSAAKAKCDEIKQAADVKIEEIKNAVEAEIDNEGQDIVSRAKSTSMMKCREIMLASKSNALEKAFEDAEKKILSLPDDEYLKLVIGFSSEALKDAPDGSVCIVSANAADIQRFGNAIVDNFKAIFTNVSFKLSDKPVDISGGFLLDFGLTDADCSVKAVMSQSRPSLEAGVCKILFDRTVKK